METNGINSERDQHNYSASDHCLATEALKIGVLPITVREIWSLNINYMQGLLARAWYSFIARAWHSLREEVELLSEADDTEAG